MSWLWILLIVVIAAVVVTAIVVPVVLLTGSSSSPVVVPTHPVLPTVSSPSPLNYQAGYLSANFVSYNLASSSVSDAQVTQTNVAVADQINTDYYQLYGRKATMTSGTLATVNTPLVVDPSTTPIFVIANGDFSNVASAYHSITSPPSSTAIPVIDMNTQDSGIPVGTYYMYIGAPYIVVYTDNAPFSNASTTNVNIFSYAVSHEVLELLTDLYVNLSAAQYSWSGSFQGRVSYEVCDALEFGTAAQYSYVNSDTQISLANFITSEWFNNLYFYRSASKPIFDFLQVLTEPFQILPISSLSSNNTSNEGQKSNSKLNVSKIHDTVTSWYKSSKNSVSHVIDKLGRKQTRRILKKEIGRSQ